MIQANQLRIGSLIFYKGEIVPVTMVGIFGIQSKTEERIINAKFSTGDLEPIPLTEELIIKCGFEKELLEDDDYYYSLRLSDHEYCGLSLLSGDRDGVIEVFLFPYENIRYKYLHEVQNAYHSLTGKELEVKI